MSATIRTSDLRPHLDRYGPLATVITVSAAQRPHVVTSMVGVDGEHLVVDVGPRTAGHLADRPWLCITWAAPASEDYLLIVDGDATDVEPRGEDFRVRVAPRSGIRHRSTDAAGDGPSCIRLGDEVIG